MEVKIQENLRYEFNAPDGWTVQPTEGGAWTVTGGRDRVIVSPFEGSADFPQRIYIDYEENENLDARMLAENQIRMYQNAPDFHLYNNASEISVGPSGEPNAYNVTYAYKTPQIKLKISETFLKFGKYYLRIGYASSEEAYDKYYSDYEDFLQSVEFKES